MSGGDGPAPDELEQSRAREAELRRLLAEAYEELLRLRDDSDRRRLALAGRFNRLGRAVAVRAPAARAAYRRLRGRRG